jgi:hypothetical protein
MYDIGQDNNNMRSLSRSSLSRLSAVETIYSGGNCSPRCLLWNILYRCGNNSAHILARLVEDYGSSILHNFPGLYLV